MKKLKQQLGKEIVASKRLAGQADIEDITGISKENEIKRGRFSRPIVCEALSNVTNG